MARLKIIENSNSVEIHVPHCDKCGEPMRMYHYFMKQLTPDKKDVYVEEEGTKITKIYDFEFLCPKHRNKKDAYHMNPTELVEVNKYDKSQFKMMVESEPDAKVSEKLYFGKDAKKVRV